MHGKGVFAFVGGTRYEGQFRTDFKHGLGRFTHANGDSFEGGCIVTRSIEECLLLHVFFVMMLYYDVTHSRLCVVVFRLIHTPHQHHHRTKNTSKSTLQHTPKHFKKLQHTRKYYNTLTTHQQHTNNTPTTRTNNTHQQQHTNNNTPTTTRQQHTNNTPTTHQQHTNNTSATTHQQQHTP
jgi:hypothetical protein